MSSYIYNPDLDAKRELKIYDTGRIISKNEAFFLKKRLKHTDFLVLKALVLLKYVNHRSLLRYLSKKEGIREISCTLKRLYRESLIYKYVAVLDGKAASCIYAPSKNAYILLGRLEDIKAYSFEKAYRHASALQGAISFLEGEDKLEILKRYGAFRGAASVISKSRSYHFISATDRTRMDALKYVITSFFEEDRLNKDRLIICCAGKSQIKKVYAKLLVVPDLDLFRDKILFLSDLDSSKTLGKTHIYLPYFEKVASKIHLLNISL